MTAQDYLDLADRFIGAIEAGDVDAVRAAYAPDARIWHNHDEIEQTADENLKVLAWMDRTISNRHYRIVRREALADGFFQQHVLEASLPDGTPWTLNACVVVRIKDGKITRLDEYLDSAQAAVLMAKTR